MTNLNFQIKLTSNMNFVILDPAKRLTDEQKYTLNTILRCRENFDNDFLSDVKAYRTKKFQNYYVDFVSTSEKDVIEIVDEYNRIKQVRDEELEYYFSECIRAELIAAGF